MYLLVRAAASTGAWITPTPANARRWRWACTQPFHWQRPGSAATRHGNCWPKALIPTLPSKRRSKPKQTAAANTFEVVARDLADKDSGQAGRSHAAQDHDLAGKGCVPLHWQDAHIQPLGRVTCWTRLCARLKARGVNRHRAPCQADMRTGIPVCGGHRAGRAGRDRGPARRTGSNTEGALCSHHRAKAGGRPDALDIRLHRAPLHRGGAQVVAAGVCTTR